MSVPSIDMLLGLHFYATKTAGIGGAIRRSVDDFVVEEVLVDGSRATAQAENSSRALGASSSRQQYLLCVLVKRNWDTLVAIKNIARQLRIDQRAIDIAGIKDAKATTAQHITIELGSQEDISKVKVEGVELRFVGYFRDKMSSYYLLGNRFGIKIRDVFFSKSVIEERISKIFEELESIGGIPNFFGHQRFGTTRPLTHLVGKAILEGDIRKAAFLFLAYPSTSEHPESRQARAELELNQDFKQSFKNFPKQLRFERMMLSHLAENPDDFVGAFGRLPLKLRNLFVQAHQSYLFNRFLSERIRRKLLLNKAVVGDYCLKVERSGLPMINAVKTVSDQDLTEVNDSIAKGRLRVALPLIGLKQKRSQGIIGEIEQQILEEENVQADNFRIDPRLEINVRGGLRTAVSPIRDFKIQELTTEDPQGLSSEFMLLRGSYATMLLREIMKSTDPIAAGF